MEEEKERNRGNFSSEHAEGTRCIPFGCDSGSRQ